MAASKLFGQRCSGASYALELDPLGRPRQPTGPLPRPRLHRSSGERLRRRRLQPSASTPPEEIARSLRAQFATGVTRLYPTVITGAPDEMAACLRNLAAAREARRRRRSHRRLPRGRPAHLSGRRPARRAPAPVGASARHRRVSPLAGCRRRRASASSRSRPEWPGAAALHRAHHRAGRSRLHRPHAGRRRRRSPTRWRRAPRSPRTSATARTRCCAAIPTTSGSNSPKTA